MPFVPSPYSYGFVDPSTLAISMATQTGLSTAAQTGAQAVNQVSPPSQTPSYAPPSAAPAQDGGYTQYAQAARAFLGLEDPQVEAARTEAEIRNLQALIPTSSGPIRTYRLNQIAKLQAKLEVLRQQAADSAYASELTTMTRLAVAASSVIGTVIVLGGVALMGGLIINQVQMARIRNEELRRLRVS